MNFEFNKVFNLF